MTISPTNTGFRMGIYVFKDAEVVDYAAACNSAYVGSNPTPASNHSSLLLNNGE